MEILDIFIGYDEREKDAYLVCRDSLIAHASIPVRVTPVDQDTLRHTGLYRRAPRPGTWDDTVDGAPFSTAFSFTRFLVPALMQYRGWGLFVDCDFLFRRDVKELFDLREPNKALMCVQHDYRPVEQIKMDGRAQEPYPKKNWSSLVLYNCGHEANRKLTPDVVSRETGRWLHNFKWVPLTQIGSIPEEWNYLIGHSNEDMTPSAVHFTRGIPSMDGYENEPYADEWRSYLVPYPEGIEGVII